MFKIKPYRISLIALSLVLFCSTAYAFTNYQISFNGYANLSGNVQLEFINFSILGARTGESVGYAQGYTTTRDKLSMNLYVATPNDVRNVVFYIRNVGGLNTTLADWSTSFPSVAETGLEFTLPELQNTVIPPGATYGPYSLTVWWNPAHIFVASGPQNFMASINYHR